MKTATSLSLFLLLSLLSSFTNAQDAKVFGADTIDDFSIKIDTEFDKSKEVQYQTHKKETWRNAAQTADAKDSRINLYTLGADANGIIRWSAPDGNNYYLDPRSARPGVWAIVRDTDGNERLGYYHGGSSDSKLVLSLEGANSIASTLLHSEDDVADVVYYLSTDGGNNNPIDPQKTDNCLILRAKGVRGAPVKAYRGFKVMTVRQ